MPLPQHPVKEIEDVFAAFKGKNIDETAAALLVLAYKVGGLEHQLNEIRKAVVEKPAKKS